ncbi:MAG TPA: sterol desaturase family protein [Polyangiales bacterium]|nr:sterol desaturase family protein [Polyangiales bacterium]
MSLLIYLAVPVFLATIWLEYALLERRGVRSYERQDLQTSLGLGIGNVVVSASFKGVVLAIGYVLYEHRLFEIGQSVWAWAALFFAEDFCYYVYHRSHHEVRCLWAAHVNHHSSQSYHFGTALRQSFTTPLTGFWFWLPLPLLGFHPLMVMTQQAISLVYQFWLHTELVGRLGPLEWFFNTPSHHRVHHASNPRYLDTNHAGILIIWDRLFGSFVPEHAAEPPRYGLTQNLKEQRLFHAAFHEWRAIWDDVRSAKRWRHKLAYIFGPPGYSHDGSRQTARQLRAAAAASSTTPAAPPRRPILATARRASDAPH